MRNIFNNRGYFIKEAVTALRINLMSNIFSILSIGLIFFLLTMVASGWWASSKVVDAIQGEAEISVYFKEGIKDASVYEMLNKIKAIDGVREVRLVDENEAYDRMVKILGKEASVLKYLEDNPFSSFIEVKIHIEKMDSVLEKVQTIADVEQVRDNREVLERLKNLSGMLKLIGYVFVIAVSTCTLLIVSHIIRMGIYNNREQINTLRLLGAPEYFIALPFFLDGLMMTISGGILCLLMAVGSVKSIYSRMTGPLPFIPLPSLDQLIWGNIVLIIFISITLGVIGSFIGMKTAKEK
jgi:cell division transport system permease protein